MIDFEIPAEVAELRERVAAFVAEVVIPAEARDHGGHGPSDELRDAFNTTAKAAAQ